MQMGQDRWTKSEILSHKCPQALHILGSCLLPSSNRSDRSNIGGTFLGSVLKAAFKIKVALIDNYLGGIWNTSETLEMGQS
jgi:hypothetical protein